MHTARSGDRNVVGGDRGLPDRGYGFKRRGDRWLPDRWFGPGAPVAGNGGGVTPPPTSGVLTLWPDSSGKGKTATAVGLPNFVKGVLNAKPVVRFASASSDGFNFPPIALVRPSVIVAVMKVQAVGKLMYALGGDGSFGAPFDLINSDGKVLIGNPTEYTALDGVDLSAWHVFTFWPTDSAFPKLFVDGAEVLFQTQGPAAGTNYKTLGYNIIQPAFSDGDLAEVSIQLNVNRNTDTVGIESYFGHQYGISTASNASPQVRPDQASFIAAWWSASALWIPSNLNDGDTVTEWPDVSGQGHHGEKTGNPIFKKNIIGGKPVVRLRSASQDGFNLIAPIPSTGPITFFTVMSRLPGKQILGLMSATNWGVGVDPSGVADAGSSFYVTNTTVPIDSGNQFRVLTSEHINGSTANIFVDGTLIGNGATSPNNDPYNQIGSFVTTPAVNSSWSDGDIAEIIVYSGAVALRLKLTLLITTLLVTGEFPSPAEFDHLVGHRHRIRRYLHLHGANPTQAQLDAVVTPMAAGDRSNIEAALGWKYGIPVAAGVPVNPATVPGMLTWYKADSLIVPGPPDPSAIPGLKLWMEADTLHGGNGASVPNWPEISGNGNVAHAVAAATFVANSLNGKPSVSNPNGYFNLNTIIPGAGPWTVVSLFAPSLGGTQFFSLGSDTTNGPCGARVYNDGTLYLHTGGSIYGCGPAPSGYHMYSGTSAPGMYVDGVARSPVFAFAGAAGNFQSVCGESGSLTNGSGNMVACIMFDHISDAHRLIAENYLRAKYGTP